MGLDSYIFSLPKRGFTFGQTIEVLQNKWEFEKKTIPNEEAKNAYSDLYENEDKVLKQWAYWRKAWDLHHLFVNSFQGGVDDCSIHDEITKEDIVEIKNYALEKLSHYNNEEGIIINCYKYNDDGTTTLIECDGFEIEYGDGKTKRFDTSYPVFVNEDSDDWEKMHYEDTVKYCNEILTNFDFENNFLFYVSSW